MKENNLERDNEKVIVDVENDGLNQSFSLTFLNSFCKASNLTDNVKLYMTENSPLVIEYKISDLGELKYYLAPKLQD